MLCQQQKAVDAIIKIKDAACTIGENAGAVVGYAGDMIRVAVQVADAVLSFAPADSYAGLRFINDLFRLVGDTLSGVGHAFERTVHTLCHPSGLNSIPKLRQFIADACTIGEMPHHVATELLKIVNEHAHITETLTNPASWSTANMTSAQAKQVIESKSKINTVMNYVAVSA